MPRRLFSAHPVAMARIPLRPDLGTSPNSEGLLTEGVFLASRSLDPAFAEHDDRTRATLRAYDIRSRRRTTPHGVFAGVAPAFLNAPAPTLRLGRSHRTIIAPNPRWLAGVADQLLRDEPGLLPKLTLTTTNLITRRGGRLETERPTEDGASVASVRETTVSRWLLDACTPGAPAAHVLAELAARHPDVPPSAIEQAVRNMVEAGLLLTDILPEDPRDDPIGHLLARLPEQTPSAPALTQLRGLLEKASALAPGAPQRRQPLSAARDLADQLHYTTRPFSVDVLADADIALPAAFGDSAALAATVLWRIGHRRPPLTDYHRRFRRKYGRHRLVPLLEVLDPVTGLGPPTSHDALGVDEDLDPARTATLASLLAEALSFRSTEIVLQDHHLDQLANSSPLSPPRTAEIHLQPLNDPHGTVSVAVSPGTGSQDAGATSGRWTRWLPELAPTEPADDGMGTMTAEIVCRSRTAATAALNIPTHTTPWRIPLGVPAQPNDIPPAELALTTNGDHLLLWSTRHQRPVTPVLHSRVAPRLLSPAARTLHLLAHAGNRPWHPWGWGPFAAFPYTPRVRYRDILLTPARWQIPDRLSRAAANRNTFSSALDAWRDTTHPAPPDTLVVVENDRHLPLDLNEPHERELLRRSIHRGTRTLHEPLGTPEALATLTGPDGERHRLELVVPLVRRDTSPATTPNPRRALRSPHLGRHLPGSNWLSAALPAPPDLHDALLTELTPLLNHLTSEADIDRWFWLRYTTPALGPHLRLRFHGEPATLVTRAHPQLASTVTQLTRSGLCDGLHLEPYDQETERYGGPHAVIAAEYVFSTDSQLTLHALPYPEDQRLLIAAASAADIATTLAPDQPHHALNPGRLTQPQRHRRDELRTTLRDNDAHQLIPPPLADLHAERHKTLLAYRDTLTPHIAAHCASDVIHMHSNRIISTDPGHERVIRTLAADLIHRP